MNKVKETFYSNFFDIGTELNSALYQRNKIWIYLCLHWKLLSTKQICLLSQRFPNETRQWRFLNTFGYKR